MQQINDFFSNISAIKFAVSCAGYVPAPLETKGGKAMLIGDCKSVGNLRSVVWSAYEAAMKI